MKNSNDILNQISNKHATNQSKAIESLKCLFDEYSENFSERDLENLYYSGHIELSDAQVQQIHDIVSAKCSDENELATVFEELFKYLKESKWTLFIPASKKFISSLSPWELSQIFLKRDTQPTIALKAFES